MTMSDDQEVVDTREKCVPQPVSLGARVGILVNSGGSVRTVKECQGKLYYHTWLGQPGLYLVGDREQNRFIPWSAVAYVEPYLDDPIWDSMVRELEIAQVQDAKMKNYVSQMGTMADLWGPRDTDTTKKRF